MEDRETAIDYLIKEILDGLAIGNQGRLDEIVYEYMDGYDDSELREVFPDAFKGGK